MNIGIVAWSLFETRGGIERNACNLAAAMLQRGHGVTIFYKRPSVAGAVPQYDVPTGASLVGLDLDYDTTDIGPSRALVAAQNLDVLVAMFSWESLLWFPALVKGTNTRLVISEHSTPDLINAKWNRYEREACLFSADRIRVLAGRFVPQYPEALHERMAVIPNPAYLSGSPAQRPGGKERYTLLGAGRFFEKVKQFSLLIRAFSLLRGEFPEWDLEICGDGEAYALYEGLVNELGLAGRVRLPGMIGDLSSHYGAADLFCIPSFAEGFGMVVVEAQHYALPVVGFASCPGVNDIVIHEENGLLAAEMTPESLAASLAALMRDETLRKRLGERGRQMLDRYEPEKVFDDWEHLLADAVADPGGQRIQRILDVHAPDTATAAAAEILRREHPFDRRSYLHMHAEAKRHGEPSLFTDQAIRKFRKKQEKFCFPGFRSPAAMVKKFLRAIKNRCTAKGEHGR